MSPPTNGLSQRKNQGLSFKVVEHYAGHELRAKSGSLGPVRSMDWLGSGNKAICGATIMVTPLSIIGHDTNGYTHMHSAKTCADAPPCNCRRAHSVDSVKSIGSIVFANGADWLGKSRRN